MSTMLLRLCAHRSSCFYGTGFCNPTFVSLSAVPKAQLPSEAELGLRVTWKFTQFQANGVELKRLSDWAQDSIGGNPGCCSLAYLWHCILEQQSHPWIACVLRKQYAILLACRIASCGFLTLHSSLTQSQIHSHYSRITRVTMLS